MATATQSLPTLLTLDEYLHTSYDPDCDFVEGYLEERNVGEREHSVLQIALGAWFFNRRKEWNIIVMSEQRTRVSENRVRLPDICLVSADAPYEKVTTTPPLIAVEIMSPEDSWARVMRRLDDILAMGIQHVWLLDPSERTAFIYASTGLKLVKEPRIEFPGSPIYLDLPEIFSALD